MPDYVSINGHTIRANAVLGKNDPPIRIAKSKNDRAPKYAREIEISEPCRLVYSPRKPLIKCGARLVIEAPTGSVKVLR
jgi:hypothetical protein